MLITKRMKKRFTFYLGCLYWYIRHLDNPGDFDEAMAFLAEIGVRLGVTWDGIEAACKAWQQEKENLGRNSNC